MSDFVNMRLSRPSSSFVPIPWQKVYIPIWERGQSLRLLLSETSYQLYYKIFLNKSTD